MEKNKIFGIEFNNTPIKVSEKFDEVYFDEDNVFFVSKETFKHEEEGLTFNYKYAIQAAYCEGRIYYSLELVPCADSLCEKKRNDIISSCGCEDEEISIYDIVSYGCSVSMGCESVESEEIDERYFDLIASVFETTDRLRGFYLDKYVNRIGNTGWDLLEDFINGIPYLSKVC